MDGDTDRWMEREKGRNKQIYELNVGRARVVCAVMNVPNEAHTHNMHAYTHLGT